MSVLETAFDLADRCAPVLLTSAVKVAALLLIAWGVALLLRRRAAAARHLVWFTAVVLCLALPVLEWRLPQWEALPAWEVEGITRSVSRPGDAIPSPGATIQPPAAFHAFEDPIWRARMMPPEMPNWRPAPSTDVVEASPVSWYAHALFNAWSAAAVLWIIGSLIVISRIPLSYLRLRRLRRAAVAPVPQAWLEELHRLASQMNIRRNVELRIGHQFVMPMAWGVLAGLGTEGRSTILMPRIAHTWSTAQRRAVLLHELAHIKRMDCLTQLFAQFACALYWPIPLIWLAARRMLVERERACDDLVLAHIGDAPHYAELLLRLVAQCRSIPTGSHVAATMARMTKLESRLRAILDASLNRKPVTTLFAAGLFAGLLAVAAPMAMLAAGEAEGANEEPQTTTAPATRPTMDVTVLDQATGKPIPHPRITVRAGHGPTTFTADEQGRYRVELSEDGTELFLIVRAAAEGYVPLMMYWSKRENVLDIPDAFTFSLEKGTTIGGRVVDEEGRPIEGATLFLTAFATRREGQPHVSTNDDPVRTDAQGRWRCDTIPADARHVSVRKSHPQYISDEQSRGEEATLEELRDESAVFVMRSGVRLAGRVLDAQGNPIEGAYILQGAIRGMGHQPHTRSDAEGNFVFDGSKPGQTVLTVHAIDKASDLKILDVTKNIEDIEFRLNPAKILRLKIVDEDGNPIKNARVVPGLWRGYHTFEIWRTSDENGEVEWTDAPEDAVTYGVGAQGYAGTTSDLTIVADGRQRVVVLRKPMTITGRVVDDATGEVIPSFEAIPVMVDATGPPHILRDEAVDGKDGQFKVTFTRDDIQHRVRIEADGYIPAVTNAYPLAYAEHREELRLKPGPAIRGRVIGPDGRPAAGAMLVLSTPGNVAILHNGTDVQGQGCPTTQSDEEGRFTFRPQSTPFLIMAFHDGGYGTFKADETPEVIDLVLEPWARVEGVARIGTEPARLAAIRVIQISDPPADEPHAMHFIRGAPTNEEGVFILDRLTPGTYQIGLEVRSRTSWGSWYSSPTSYQRVTVNPGDNLAIQIGGMGRAVTGRLVLPDALADRADMIYDMMSIQVRLDYPEFPEPADWPRMSAHERQAWREQWLQTEPGKAYQTRIDAVQSQSRRYSTAPDATGRFTIPDVAAGTYQFSASVSAPSPNAPDGAYRTLASASHEFTVPEMPTGRDDWPLDIGEIRMTAHGLVEAGALAPDFEAPTLDGRPIRLADFRGKYILLDFWATWCVPCLAETPHLKAVYDAMRGRDDFVMIGLSLDQNPDAPKAYAEKQNLEWIQAFLGEWSKTDVPKQYGVQGIPSIWLIGPDGKVIARDLRGAGILRAVRAATDRDRF